MVSQGDIHLKLEKKYATALDNYGQSCFAWSDFLKMKCVCKTQMTIRNNKQVNLHYLYKHHAKY